MRDRALQAIQRWAARQIERRLRREWDAYREGREVKTPMFRRSGKPGVAQVTRSLIQINFVRAGDDR